MKTVAVTIPANQIPYEVYIGDNILQQIPQLIHLEKYSKVVIITNDFLEKTWLDKVTKAFTEKAETIIINATEDDKSIKTVTEIWQNLLELGCDRKSLVINLGGGVIGDMGGFAASTFMRGIDFVQIPTTLLSVADASIGGKTGINFVGIKNLIGTFQQPKAIIVDTTILETLPEREFLNGFAEMIKQGLIQDKPYFEKITAKKPKAFTQEELVDIITRSCELKSQLVMQDETEQGPRKILNFGHTIGHAIEALSWDTEMPLRHGEAVNIGMIAETEISKQVGLLSSQEADHIINTLKQSGLPTAVKDINVKGIVNKIVKDKKNSGGQVKWVLLKQVGEAVYDQLVDETIVEKAIETIIE